VSLLGPLRRAATTLPHLALQLGALSLTLFGAPGAQAQELQIQFSVPAQPLSSGLLQLGDQAHVSVAVPQNLIAGKLGPAVIGPMSVRAALTRILAPAGLTFEFVSADAVRILPAAAPAVPAPTVPAQPAAAPRQSPEGNAQLEEITVSARRRDEPLQRVPVAVSVMSGTQAAAHDLNNIQDMSAEIPTVDFRTGASNKDRDIFIRGVGTVTTSPGVEPAVSMVVDGVVLARPGQATLEVLDVDRVEILRGPQGTLFGKNATAGAVNIVTTDPGPDWHGYADASWFGGGSEYQFKGGISGALIQDTLVARLSGVVSGYDGNVTNLYNGTTVNGYERQGGHVKLVFTPSEELKVTVNGDYLHSLETVPTGVPEATAQIANLTGLETPNPVYAAALARDSVVASPANVNISDNVNTYVEDDNGGASVTVDQQLGAYALTSITAYRTWRNTQHQDFDQMSQLTPYIPELADDGDLSFDQVSEEARIASPKGQFIDYVAGLYYLHTLDTESYQRSLVQLTDAEPVANSGTAHYDLYADNYAVFGEGNVNFTDSFRAILGARLVRDDIGYRFLRETSSPVAVIAIPAAFATAGSTADYCYADRIGLQYDIDTDVDTYVTYSHGCTGPAYNVYFGMTADDELALKPESSNSYEVGMKSGLWEERLQLNMAAYITDFDNYQTTIPSLLNGALVTRLINAGEVSTKGLEADILFRLTDSLTWRGAVARSDARIEHFQCQQTQDLNCNLDGQPLPFAPDWKLNVDGSEVIALSGKLDVVLDSDYKWQSKVQYQLTEEADTIQGAYGIWDGSIGLHDAARGWRVSALVKNIADTHYSSYLAHGDLAGVMRWVPRDNDRYAGVEIQKTF
jgi:iron complex outermembrane recepter protein